MEAQGIAHRADGKVVFVEGALPFETVSVNTNRRKSSFDKAVVTTIHRESSQRVTPGCPHFGLHNGACGGCKMQHMHADAQVAVKQRVLEDNLWHLGKVRPDSVLRPIHGPTWGYRYRARLSVRYVRKKGEVLVGFHERKSGYVADMQQCRVLPRVRQRPADAVAQPDRGHAGARGLPADRTGRGRRRRRARSWPWCCATWCRCRRADQALLRGFAVGHTAAASTAGAG